MKRYILRLGFIVICFLLVRCAPVVSSINEPDPRRFPTQESDTLTPTSTPTATPTPTATLPNTKYNDSIKTKSDCLSGTSKAYQKLASINEYDVVNVLGKNNDAGDWALVRWNTVDCWIEGSVLHKFQEYKSNLEVVATPLPPTSVAIAPSRTPKPDDVSSPNNGAAQTQAAQDAQAAQAAQTAQAAQAALTAQAAQAALTAQAAQVQTAQAAQVQTAQAAQVQTAQAAQAQTAQALTNEAARGRQCNDGLDNDLDGKTDFPADDGCRNSGDDSE